MTVRFEIQKRRILGTSEYIEHHLFRRRNDQRFDYRFNYKEEKSNCKNYSLCYNKIFRLMQLCTPFNK